MRLEEAVQLSEADRESEVAVDILRDAIQTARQLHFWLQEAVKMMREHSHTHTQTYGIDSDTQINCFAVSHSLFHSTQAAEF